MIRRYTKLSYGATNIKYITLAMLLKCLSPKLLYIVWNTTNVKLYQMLHTIKIKTAKREIPYTIKKRTEKYQQCMMRCNTLKKINFYFIDRIQ